MANIPKYSPKQRALLEKQMADYQTLMDDLLKNNPAFVPQAPIVLPGGGETITDEDVTRNPGPNDPGGTTKKHSRTTNQPSTVFQPTTQGDTVRSEYDRLRTFINEGRLDLADDARLAQRFPISTEEALDIAAGQLSGNTNAKKIATFADLVEGFKGGTPQQQAHHALIRGLVPDDGLTFLRTLLPGARDNPRLLATLMNTLNNTGAGQVVDYNQIGDLADAKADMTTEGMKSGLQTTGAASPADIDASATKTEGRLTTAADTIHPSKRGMAQLEEGASRKIGANRRNTLFGVLAAGAAAEGSRRMGMWGGPDEADKFNKTAYKYLFGAGGPDTASFGKEGGYEDALSAAFQGYVGREFGDEKSTQRKAFLDLVGKHQQTINRLGEGTLKSDAGDAGYKALTDDLSRFYSSGGYDEKAPIILPYGGKGKAGAIAIEKSGKRFNRLKGTDFETIND